MRHRLIGPFNAPRVACRAADLKVSQVNSYVSRVCDAGRTRHMRHPKVAGCVTA
jgi:hypothetical protein